MVPAFAPVRQFQSASWWLLGPVLVRELVLQMHYALVAESVAPQALLSVPWLALG